MAEVSELEIRKAVRERYSKLANTESGSCESGCCRDDIGSASCCSESSLIAIGEAVPNEASSINAGCGSPLQQVDLRQGEVVLDLGSGGGIDVFRASPLVGAKGKAIGVDSTPEMIWRARETAEKNGSKYANTEFRLGEIEHLPVETESVDYVISNCVINLSPDKEQVFKEAWRVLKPGGMFTVADMTVDTEIPGSFRNNMGSWSACLAGALSDEKYRRLLVATGFERVKIDHVSSSSEKLNLADQSTHQVNFFGSHIRALKPLLK